MGRYSGSDWLRQQITEFKDAMEMLKGLRVDERLLASDEIEERPSSDVFVSVSQTETAPKVY